MDKKLKTLKVILVIIENLCSKVSFNVWGFKLKYMVVELMFLDFILD
jgi:hypothetical protein